MKQRVGMLIDVTKCMGCRACQVACKQWNKLPGEKTEFTGSYQNPKELSKDTWTLIQFTESCAPNEDPGKQDDMKWMFRKRACCHCGDASCLKACPTGAIRKSPEGIVYIEQSLCAGCKYCMESCPFDVPKPDHEAGTAIKCRLCIDRVSNGLKPACASACSTGAITYGNWKGLRRDGEARVAEIREKMPDARLYGATELGGMGVMYVLPAKASVFGLPENPVVPFNGLTMKWLIGIIPGVALLAWMANRFRQDEVAATSGSERSD